MKYLKQKLKKGKGFTLAEMLLTVALIIILLGVGFIAYTQWMRTARFRHNNDVANTVFSVLQSELSERRGNNNLDEIDRVLGSSTNAAYSGKLDGYLGSITTENGTTDTNYDKIYSGYKDDDGKSPIRPGPIYYVKGTKTDWATYQTNPASVNPALAAVYDMLSGYLFNGDSDLLDGAFCVEFDPTEGMVYSVFFSEQAESLGYTAPVDNLLNRTNDARWKYTTGTNRDLVGYCGVESLSVSTSKITTKPVIQNLMLYNENTLHLDFNLSVTPATKLMTYNITLFDAKDDKKLVDIEMNQLQPDINSPIVQGNEIYNLKTLANAKAGRAVVDCRVKRYDGANVVETKIMTFPAWVNESGKITLVLDALDYWTAQEDLQKAYGNYTGNGLITALGNTFSIYRLGIQNTDDIYCAVYATGGGFSTSATKKSNQANRAFNTSDTSNHDFKIANARHLNNLRFEETAAANATAADYTYTLLQDIDLAGTPVYSNYTSEVYTDQRNTTGIKIGDTPILADTEARNFPSFPVLGEKSTLKSSLVLGNLQHALADFIISKDNNITWIGFAQGSELDENGTGLFIENKGAIQSVKMTDTVVKGIATETGYADYLTDRTGTFCGTNAGTLENLETVALTEDSASVTGQDYVGGVFGYFEKPTATDPDVTLEKLVNAATVTGERYVGGIVGLVSGTETAPGDYKVSVKKCKNFGAVTGKKVDGSTLEPAYIGGIVGLVDTASVVDCISNPQQSTVPTKESLSGYCVGGIAGFAYDTKLNDSSTALQPGYKTGVVAGDRYVGGIVGLCVGKSVISGSAAKAAVNAVNVYGNDYVGGIVGCNANIKVLPSSKVVTVGETEFAAETAADAVPTIGAYIKTFTNPDDPWYAAANLDPKLLTPISAKPTEDELTSITVQFWNNQGLVIGYEHYAGGITGYNTGSIYDCSSSVYQNAAEQADCDYAGGIAGYNNGTLKKTTSGTLDVVCAITGQNYVGGVVGYNDVDATVNNYKVSGGSVKGNGSFVGGYAGFNASEKLLQQEINDVKTAIRVEANLSAITGNYAVGGTIGGNIVPTQVSTGGETVVLAQFNVDNFLADTSGKVAVGGYIGFNALPAINCDPADYRDALHNKVSDAATSLNSIALDTTTGTRQNVLTALETAADVDTGFASAGIVKLEIGNPDRNKISYVTGNSLTGQLAVGGVIGYSADKTHLLIQNVENKMTVIATQSVPAAQLIGLITGLQQSKVNGGAERYSLVGGVIGIVNQYTELINCRNFGAGDVKGVGTYVGGLAETSAGKITDCQIGTVGSATHDFVGGLVGMNFGEITKTRATAAAVTGQKYTGGIAAENYGKITLDGDITGLTVLGNGDYTGGIVGYNGFVTASGGDKIGTITMANGFTANVTSTGSDVGGVVGHNAAGSISTEGATAGASVKGTVTGGDMVGGIVGLHDSGELSQLVNAATVTATGNNGNAAGIVGKLGGMGTNITRCINTGTVTATSGNAAGIVGENNAKVDHCANYAAITAPAGSVGGICVTNGKEGDGILNCAVTANTPADDTIWWGGFPNWIRAIGTEKAQPTITLQGYTNAGGIVANNNGTVSGSILRNITIENYPNSPATSLVGGIAGVNGSESEHVATINMVEGAANYSAVTVRTNTNNAAAGGIAGSNYGEIKGNGAVLGGKETHTTTTTVTTTRTYNIYESMTSTSGYINTEYLPNADTEVEFVGNVVSGTDAALFGSRIGFNEKNFGIQYLKTNQTTPPYYYRPNYRNQRPDYKNILNPYTTLNEKATFTLSKSSFTVGAGANTYSNTMPNAGSQTFDTSDGANRYLYIFAINDNAQAKNNENQTVTMYSMKVKDDGLQTHNYLPASYTDSTGTHYGVLDIGSHAVNELSTTYDNTNPAPFLTTDFKEWQGKVTTTNPEFGDSKKTIDVNSTETHLVTITAETNNLTLAIGNAVTTANLGNAVGINAQDATVQDVIVKMENVTGSAMSDTATLLGDDNYGYGGIVGLNDGNVTGCRFNGTATATGSSAAIANVGGIAGKNTANGSIVNCRVGTEANTTVKATEYGYVGGITGWNLGEIINCDNSNSLNTVAIENNCGHVGGLVGYAAAGSLLTGTADNPTTTGEKWSVNAKGYSNDCGTGGIIGYSESGNRGRAMAYVINNAVVTGNGTGGNNMAIGGIIGRFQNNENANMVLSHCENNGSITGTGGTTLMGGMVGRLKYLGATFQNCRNTAALSGSTAAGMLGDVYQNTSANLFDSCVNTGVISATGTAGGIIGIDYGGNTGKRSDFINCVNAGNLKAPTAGGIDGKLSNNGTSFVRCRNYGQVNNSNSGYGMAVINPTSHGGVTFTDCFDFRTENSQLVNNDANSEKVKDSYFYSGELTENAAMTMQTWINNPTDGNAPAAENAGKAQHADDSSKNGLPLSFMKGTDTLLQLTSYKVSTATSNPVARIGIPKYDGSTNISKPTVINYQSMEETRNDAGISVMEQYYRDKYASLPDSKVSNLTLSQTGDKLSATWGPVANAYGYKVCYEIVNADGTTERYYLSNIVYGTSWAVNAPDDWAGKTINVHVKAVSGSDPAWTAADGTNPISGCYTSSDDSHWGTATTTVKATLPAPDVYLELDGMTSAGIQTNAGNYIAVLRNTAAYDAYLEANPDQTIKISVNVTSPTITYTIIYNPDNRMSAHSTEGKVQTKSLDNVTVQATAIAYDTANTQVNVSASANQQTWMTTGDNLKNKKAITKATYQGFTGTLPAELAFGVTISTNTDKAFLYQETELVTERKLNDTVTIPMVVSGNITRLTITDKSLPIALTNLPESLLEDQPKFSVYSYPWNGQNNAIYFGHAVATGVTGITDLLALKDPERNNNLVFDSATSKPNPGYVVYQNTDSLGKVSYDVRYSALLANETNYTNNINVATYTYDQTDVRAEGNLVKVTGGIQTGAGSDTWQMQPVPVVTHDTSIPGVDYKFTWTDSTVPVAGKADENGRYYLQLYGIDASDDSQTRVLLKTIPAFDKNGKDDNGSNCYDANTGWQYTFTDAAGNWNYGTIILRVTKVGTASGGVTNVWPYYGEYTYTQKQHFATMTAPTVSVPTDRSDMNYNLSWNPISQTELNSTDFLCYEVQVKDTAATDAVQTATWYVTVDSDGKTVLVDSTAKPTTKQNPTDNKALLDLDAFQGRTVEVSMRALATSDATIYRDGAAGVARTLPVATRLPLPVITKLTMTPVYTAGETTPRADIVANGLTLKMEQDSQYDDFSGLFELKLEIYDDDSLGTPKYTVDMSKLSTAFMEGRFNEGNSTFNVPNTLTDVTTGNTFHLADLAGKYLYVSLRATAENNISSKWTEDKTDYPVIKTRIPRMQLTEPTFTDAGREEQQCEVYGIPVDGGAHEHLQPGGKDLMVKQQLFSWPNDKTDAGYTIHLTRSTPDVDDVVQREAIELKLERQANGTLQLNGVELPQAPDSPYELGEYQVRVEQRIMPETYSLVYTTIKSYIGLDESGENVVLYLPDNSETDTTFNPFNATGAWTKNLMVETMAKDADPDYVSSKGAYLTRTNNEVTAGWQAGTPVDMATLPVAVSGTAGENQVQVALTYDETLQKLKASYSSAVGSDSYRMILTLNYKDNDGKAHSSQPYPMVATPGNLNGDNSTFDPATMTDWAEITGATIRMIAISKNEVFGAWSAEYSLTNPVYPITYNLDGGSWADGATARTSYTQASTFTLNTPEQVGFSFAGWTEDGVTISNPMTIPAGTTGAKSFTATWIVTFGLQRAPMAAAEGMATPETAAEPTEPEAQPTAEPEATPAPTAEPAPTEAPAPTEEPAPTAEPAPTEESAPTEEPVPETS